MAVKNPLCNYNGTIKELQSGDTLPGGGGGGSSPVITEFTSSGTYTNSQTGVMRIICIGGGTGGGSGRRGAAGTERYGGGAGSPAGYTVVTVDASDLPASLPIWVAAGGNGGAAVTTNDTNGGGGSNGGASIVGGTGSTSGDVNVICSARAAGFATGGTAASQTSSQSSMNYLEGFISGSTGNGRPSSSTNPVTAGTSQQQASVGTCGGMGGGINLSNGRFNGGATDSNAGTDFGNPVYLASVAGATAVGGTGTNGSVLYARRGMYLISTGGSGGAAGDTAGTIAGGTGGNGGIGSSGGGGGASTNGANSGAGGRGGSGLVVIIHWR